MIYWFGWATLLSVILANPILTWLTTRFRPRLAVAVVYQLIALCGMLSFLQLSLGCLSPGLFRPIFYVGFGVVNLFIVTLFWAVVVDAYRQEEAATWFPAFALAGTMGALVGSALAAFAHKLLGDSGLTFLAIVFLEAAALCIAGIPPQLAEKTGRLAPNLNVPLNGHLLTGILQCAKSPYLCGLGACVLLFYGTSSWVELARADVLRAANLTKADSTTLLARVDFGVNLGTLVCEAVLALGLMRLLGPGRMLFIGPIVALAGFAGLMLRPSLLAILSFQIVQRVTEFAFSKPAREQLYTVVHREEKYQAKPMLDTFLQRLGDQGGGMPYLLLKGTGPIAIVPMFFFILMWLRVIQMISKTYKLRQCEADNFARSDC